MKLGNRLTSPQTWLALNVGSGGCIEVTIVAGHVTIDASMGKVFKLIADDDFILDKPANLSYCCQPVILVVVQDGTGGREMTLADEFRLGDDVSDATLAADADARTWVGMLNWEATGAIDIVAFVRNYQG